MRGSAVRQKWDISQEEHRRKREEKNGVKRVIYHDFSLFRGKRKHKYKKEIGVPLQVDDKREELRLKYAKKYDVNGVHGKMGSVLWLLHSV